MPNIPEPAGAAFDPVRLIEANDPVQGGAPEIAGLVHSPYNFAMRAMVNRTIWLKEQLEGLTIPDAVAAATEGTAGIGRIATLQEMREGTLTGAIFTNPRGVKEAIQHNPPTLPNATEAQRGIIERVNQTEGEGGMDNTRAMTSLRSLQLLRSSTAQATTTRRGAVEFATETEAQNKNNNTKALTAASLYRTVSAVTIDANAEMTNQDDPTDVMSDLSSTKIGDRQFFGPFEIGFTPTGNVSITGQYRTGYQSFWFELAFRDSIYFLDPSINLSNFTWNVTSTRLTGSSTTLSIAVQNNGTLRVSGTGAGSGFKTFSFTITGTLN